MNDEQTPLPSAKLHLVRILYLKELAGGQDARDREITSGTSDGEGRGEVFGDGPCEQTVLVRTGQEEGQDLRDGAVIENVELPVDIWMNIIGFVKREREKICLHRLCRNASHAVTHHLIRTQKIKVDEENVVMVKVNGKIVYVKHEYH